MKKILITIIRIYQKTLSPDSGLLKIFYPNGYCKFVPHCSEYCVQSLEKHGTIKGSLKGVYRVLRCNPWSKGGYDPV